MSFTQDLTRARNNYVAYLARLGLTCAVFRSDTDAYGKTGSMSAHAISVPYSVGRHAGSMQQPFPYSRAAGATASTPGAVPINFAYGQDVRTGDLLVTGVTGIKVGDNLNTVVGGERYQVGIIHDESPQLVGLTVDAELQRVPPL